MKMKRWIFKCLLALFLGLAFFSALALAPVQKTAAPVELPERTAQPDQLIRLRVIANSDQPRDQQLKLQVRDALLDCLRPQLKSAGSREEAEEAIQLQLPQLRSLASSTLRQAGCGLPVTVTLGVTDFPAKGYGPLVFPAGDYLALKVVIGDGGGKNWWCVLFPPLCYVDLARGEPQTISASQEEVEPGRYLSQRLALMNGLEQEDERADSLVLQNLSGDVRPAATAASSVRLTTKVGEWLSEKQHAPLISWLFRRLDRS
jgi:stage II sporulation protein R